VGGVRRFVSATRPCRGTHVRLVVGLVDVQNHVGQRVLATGGFPSEKVFQGRASSRRVLRHHARIRRGTGGRGGFFPEKVAAHVSWRWCSVETTSRAADARRGMARKRRGVRGLENQKVSFIGHDTSFRRAKFVCLARRHFYSPRGLHACHFCAHTFRSRCATSRGPGCSRWRR
jgi:hypothetical protein